MFKLLTEEGRERKAKGRRKINKKKTKQEKIVTLGETKRKEIKVRGGNNRIFLLRTNIANVSDSKGEIKKTEIKNVIETPQNRFLARQNRLMRGVLIETSLGKARITNRPSREGFINAVLLEK